MSINILLVFKVLSRILLIITIALLFCVIVSIVYSEPYFPFLLSALFSSFLSGVFYWYTSSIGNQLTINKRDAYLTVTLSWFVISLIGALPYIFSNTIPNYINAFFESVSGFTTTGASILTDIEALPKSILFWRSLTHWVGGIGIIVLVIVVMPTLQAGGYNLFLLESSLQEKIQPKIKSVGYRLFWIYLILTVIEVILLMLGKMNLYESVCHAFGTVATGGFSPKNTSIAGYSPYIQYIIMIFMLLAGINFVIHYYFLKRQFSRIKDNEEVKFYLSIIGIVGIIIMFSLLMNMNKSLEESFRESFFQVISIVTCTGFATTDYLQWPTYAWLILFFLMFLGGCSGSTAGGIKMARHLVLFKNIKRILKQQMSPNAMIPIRLNYTPVKGDINQSTLTFIFIYLLIFLLGTLAVLFTGVDGKTAASAVATCMAGIGPGMGTIGPVGNFAHLPETTKLLLSFLMVVGRLEIYTVVLLFTPFYWRK